MPNNYFDFASFEYFYRIYFFSISFILHFLSDTEPPVFVLEVKSGVLLIVYKQCSCSLIIIINFNVTRMRASQSRPSGRFGSPLNFA